MTYPTSVASFSITLVEIALQSGFYDQAFFTRTLGSARILIQVRLPRYGSVFGQIYLCGVRLQEGRTLGAGHRQRTGNAARVIEFFELSSKHSANGLQNIVMRKRFLQHLLCAECFGELQAIHRARAASS